MIVGQVGLHRQPFKLSKLKSTVGLASLYIILLFMAAVFIVPFFWLLSSSFKEPSELFQIPVRWLPQRLQFANFEKIFKLIPFFLYLRNTMIIVVSTIIGAVLSSSLVGYGFSRLRWKLRDKLFILVLITMILPYQVTMIPLFLLFKQFKWVGGYLPLIVPAFFGNPFFIFLMRQFFNQLPDDLSQAARIDGAGEFRIFWQICLPLSKPALATVAIYAFLRAWNDFIGPLIYLSDNDTYTMSIGIQLIRSRLDPKWEVLMAAGVLMVLPVLIIFFLMQKYFIQGIALSGIKG